MENVVTAQEKRKPITLLVVDQRYFLATSGFFPRERKTCTTAGTNGPYLQKANDVAKDFVFSFLVRAQPQYPLHHPLPSTVRTVALARRFYPGTQDFPPLQAVAGNRRGGDSLLQRTAARENERTATPRRPGRRPFSVLKQARHAVLLIGVSPGRSLFPDVVESCLFEQYISHGLVRAGVQHRQRTVSLCRG